MKIKNYIRFFYLFIFLQKLISAATSNPEYGRNGMVVSTSSQASKAGIEILKKGGNAIDAAVAVGFALAVTSSSNGNIGGGGFLVASFANGLSITLDHREKAPSNAHTNMFLNDSGSVIPGMSLYSRASSGVPGTVDGLIRVLEDHGSGNISLREVLNPAIELAERGFFLSYFEANRLNVYKKFFERNEAASKIFIRSDGKPWKKGQKFIQKDLAKTLKKIARYGRDGFYSGTVAQLIVQEMKRGNGLITKEDLHNYESQYRPPILGTYKGYEIVSMGPPSSGGALLVNMLNMLENYPIDTISWNSSKYIHLLTEVERRAYADRAEHMGDPDFWDVPISMLTSKEYAKSRIRNIDLNKATPSSSVSASKKTSYESPETTHYSVVDRWGNAVSVTTTINLGYGNGCVVEGAGFFLNNEMDDFSSKPGYPNAYGLVGSKANKIEPKKTPLSSMSPVIVFHREKPYLITGSPGGSTIITSVLQEILNVLDFQMSLEESSKKSRIHFQHLPDILFHEQLDDSLIKSLKKDKKLIKRKLGEVHSILLKKDGIEAFSDKRRPDGKASSIYK